MHRPVESRRRHRAALLTLGLVTAASVATLRSFSIAEARSATDVPPQTKKPASKSAKPAAKPAAKRREQPVHAASAAAQGPDGKVVYSTTCAACHQATGEGVEGTYPPLAGSEWVNGDEAKVVRIVLHGLTGPVEVAGETYSGMMPPWGGVLKDAGHRRGADLRAQRVGQQGRADHAGHGRRDPRRDDVTHHAVDGGGAGAGERRERSGS